jgi:hypothetical protein
MRARPWTTTEVRYLKENIDSMYYRDIARILNRTVKGIDRMVSTLKLASNARKGRRVHQAEWSEWDLTA